MTEHKEVEPVEESSLYGLLGAVDRAIRKLKLPKDTTIADVINHCLDAKAAKQIPTDVKEALTNRGENRMKESTYNLIAGILIIVIILLVLVIFFTPKISKFRTETTLTTKSFSPKAGVYCTQIVGNSDMAISCVKE